MKIDDNTTNIIVANGYYYYYDYNSAAWYSTLFPVQQAETPTNASVVCEAFINTTHTHTHHLLPVCVQLIHDQYNKTCYKYVLSKC